MIRAIRERDEGAMGQVMGRYSRLLWSVAASVLKNAPDQDVEECVADAFVYLWQHPERYDPGRGKLKAWLSAIARSRALDRARQLSRRQELPLEEQILEEAPPPEDGLEELLEGLSGEEQEILRRRYRDGEKPGEIAQALGLPVKRVENRLYRGRQKLRKKLDPKEGTR